MSLCHASVTGVIHEILTSSWSCCYKMKRLIEMSRILTAIGWERHASFQTPQPERDKILYEISAAIIIKLACLPRIGEHWSRSFLARRGSVLISLQNKKKFQCNNKCISGKLRERANEHDESYPFPALYNCCANHYRTGLPDVSRKKSM